MLYDGKYYAPEFGLVEGEYTYGKITSFWAYINSEVEKKLYFMLFFSASCDKLKKSSN